MPNYIGGVKYAENGLNDVLKWMFADRQPKHIKSSDFKTEYNTGFSRPENADIYRVNWPSI